MSVIHNTNSPQKIGALFRTWFHFQHFNSFVSFLHVFSESSLPSARLSQDGLWLLSQQETEAFLHRHPVSGELVIGGEPGRVGRAGWLSIGTDFLLVIITGGNKELY